MQDIEIRFWKFVIYANFTKWYILPDYFWKRSPNYDYDYLTIYFLCFNTMIGVLNKHGKAGVKYRKELRKEYGKNNKK